MIYYNERTGKFNHNAALNDVAMKTVNILKQRKAVPGSPTGIVIKATQNGDDDMKFDIVTEYLGYPIKVMFYNDGDPNFKDVLPTSMFYADALRSVNNVNEIDNAIDKINNEIAKSLADNFTAYVIMKAFERTVQMEFVNKKSFPDPERMWEEFVEFHNSAKSQFGLVGNTPIEDYWITIQTIIKKNTAFWLSYLSGGDPDIRKKYGVKSGSFVNPSIFSTYYDLSDLCDIECGFDEADKRVENFMNELNCIPAYPMQVFTPTFQTV